MSGNDLVKDLRDHEYYDGTFTIQTLRELAADEIERLQEELRLHDKAAELSMAENKRLRAALERIAPLDIGVFGEPVRIAREALRDE